MGVNEKICPDPLPQGSLRLADLAYFSLDEFEKRTENGIYWISRLKTNSYLADKTGERLALEKMLTETETLSSPSVSVSVKESNFQFI